MLKKIMLGIVAAVLLLGVVNLLAKEKTGKPKTKQKQAQKLQQEEKWHAKQQLQKQKAAKKAAQKAMEGKQQKQKSLRHKQARPIQKRFDKWFRKLTKAYRQNDREKMGQLLRNMHQFREGQTRAKDAVGEYRQDFRGRDEAGKGRHGQFHGGPCRHGQGLQRRGMGRPDLDTPPRGMGRRQQRIHGGRRGYRNPGFPHGGMRNWRQDGHSSEWDW